MRGGAGGQGDHVAPFAGAWIEIIVTDIQNAKTEVAPFAGAWIEMPVDQVKKEMTLASLRSPERGLKLP